LKKFEDILVQCIEDIRTGRSSIEDCLARYPSMRGQLEPLLKIALEIREPSDIKPSPTFKVSARVQLMDQIQARQTAIRSPWSHSLAQVKLMPYIKRFSTSMAGIILAIALAISGLGVGTVYAAQGSLPGDALYSLKLGTEELTMMMSGDDIERAERALGFAQRRMREIETLAEQGRWQDLDLAVEKYRYALNVTLTRMEHARNRGLDTGNVMARVVEATAAHILVLDEVWDMVPGQAMAAIGYARNSSETGYAYALAVLAETNAVMAVQTNLAAMEGRLNRVRARVTNMEAVQIALQQFEAMDGLSEEICRIAEEIGLNATSVEELVAEATSRHLEVLAQLYDEVTEQAQPAIERLMASLPMRYRERVRSLEQLGIEAPPAPVIPERIQQRVEEQIQAQERTREQQGQETPGQTVSVPSGMATGVSHQ